VGRPKIRGAGEEEEEEEEEGEAKGHVPPGTCSGLICDPRFRVFASSSDTSKQQSSCQLSSCRNHWLRMITLLKVTPADCTRIALQEHANRHRVCISRVECKIVAVL